MPSSLRIASPWTRRLLSSGIAVRTCGARMVATVQPDGDRWRWTVTANCSHTGLKATREEAKTKADEALNALGYALVNVPGGCTIETDEPKKSQRVYREG